jgi:stress response protein YsnF
VIERHPVSGDAERAATAGDLADGEEIRVPIMEEEVRVEKRPVVKEEVTLGKRKVTETERVDETVRREEARVETEGDAAVQFRGERERSGRYSGGERRRRRDPTYAGPERRLAAR